MHVSPGIRPHAVPAYQHFLRDALRYYDDMWLEERIPPLLVNVETRRIRSGEEVSARLPEGAARMLAEGDSNQY